jgi:hypothetical protein
MSLATTEYAICGFEQDISNDTETFLVMQFVSGFKLATGTAVCHFEAHKAPVLSLVCLDNDTLVTTSLDSTAKGIYSCHLFHSI